MEPSSKWTYLLLTALGRNLFWYRAVFENFVAYDEPIILILNNEYIKN